MQHPPIEPPGWIHESRSWTMVDLRSSVDRDRPICDHPGCQEPADVLISREFKTIDAGWIKAISYWCVDHVEQKGDSGGDN